MVSDTYISSSVGRRSTGLDHQGGLSLEERKNTDEGEDGYNIDKENKRDGLYPNIEECLSYYRSG